MKNRGPIGFRKSALGGAAFRAVASLVVISLSSAWTFSQDEKAAAPSLPVVADPDISAPSEATPAGAAPASKSIPDAASSSVPPPEPRIDPRTVRLRQQILSLVPEERHFRELLARALADTYEGRGFRPIWESQIPSEGFQRELSRELSTHGFPDLLALDPEEIIRGITDETVENRDLARSVAILDAGLLARLGAVPPEKIWKDWNRDDIPGSDDASAESVVGDLVLAASTEPFEFSGVLDALAPRNWIYRELRKAYPAAKEAILNYSGLPQIPNPSDSGVGRPGEAYPYAPALAAHLIDRGYLQISLEEASALSSMTPELVAALTAFQRDYGLDTDGIFGPSSWRYLNTNAADRYRSISLNLHRARLLPNDFGSRYVIVNLPCAELYLFEDNDFHAGTMRIVHGKASKEAHHTPIFREVMKEVVFGPYWNVPKSIAVKEVLPKAKDDWGFLSRNRYEIVSNFNPYNKSNHRLSPQNLELVEQGRLFLRQKPGPTNALGHIKFLFPNSFNVYMHDTPAKNFFLRSNRDYSHGCIRVSKPEELGAWVLKNQDWTPEGVKTAMHADERKSEMVKDEINVYVTYLTTFPRPVAGGKIVLAPARDVYSLDETDSETLAAVIPWNRTSIPKAVPEPRPSPGIFPREERRSLPVRASFPTGGS
jgi:murein L,D-transpeptidase YcbB/YkuD